MDISTDRAIPRIGFVGFGEAGFHIARGLADEGIGAFTAYDINANTPGAGEKIRTRATESRTKLVDSSAALAAASDVILSVVTAAEALNAAGQTSPHLTPRHLYADLNSISPARKQEIAAIVTASGARFAEVAVMAPVPPYGHKTPMLAGGEHAAAFAELMAPFGMRITVGGREIGRATATKLCRSIVVKGLESILTECVLGASAYGAEEDVFASLGETFPGINWPELATYMVGRVVVHGARRAREMEEVAAMLTSVGVEPIMAEAAARRMDWSARTGLNAAFHGEPPATLADFIEKVKS